MIAECTREFNDLEAGVLRKVGDRWELTEDRLEAINSAGHGQLAKAVEQPKRKRAAKKETAEE